MAGGFCNLALSALFPRFCLSCKREGQLFCLDCERLWSARPEPAACAFCSARGSNRTCEVCREKNFLDGVVSYLPYGNPVVRQAIGFWKYDGDRSIEPTIKRWIMQSQNRLRPPMEDFVVTHVPIHRSRKMMRGFDQAEILSQWIGELFTVPAASLIVRSHKTNPQAQKHHDERNVGTLDGIFVLNRTVTEIPERVLLCDDVFTSGATMDAAAKCLKEAGVKEVWGMVIGKG